MKKILFIAALATLPFVLFAQKPLKGPLDGKTYVVEHLKEGKKKPIDPPDELKFNAGKFKSKYFTDWGFTKAGIYQVTFADSTKKDCTWTTDMVNDIEEKMTWNATITGDEIEGTTELVNKKGEKKYSYSFTGTLKGNKTAKK